MDFSKLEAYLNSLVAEQGVPGCECIVTKDGKQVFRHLAGHGDYERTKPLTGNELYWMYSATKVVTAVAGMRLVEEGKIKLSDPVSKYIPEYAHLTVKTPDGEVPAENVMTIEHLFSMRGGLTYEFSDRLLAMQRPDLTTLELCAALAGEPLAFEPGTNFRYSMCLDVLGAVIEVVSGMRFGEYLDKHIFGPLGMTDSSLHLKERDKPRLAAQYARDKEKGIIVPISPELQFYFSDVYESGGGGLVSNAADYIKFAKALANSGTAEDGYHLLSRASIDDMRTNRLDEAAFEGFYAMFTRPRFYYGYGLGVRTRLSNRDGVRSPVGEFGWDGAAGAYALMDVDNNVAIVYVQHVMQHSDVFNIIHPTVRDLAYEGLGI
jgi:CubicO group peptidase (beta-lactamase class C family)